MLGRKCDITALAFARLNIFLCVNDAIIIKIKKKYLNVMSTQFVGSKDEGQRSFEANTFKRILY